ncbi:MAG: glycosyltransferase family 39 protein [Bacteroidales bacterium]|nr:glycosyltransferase family 39 protein [Bacteroidales bacterium]
MTKKKKIILFLFAIIIVFGIGINLFYLNKAIYFGSVYINVQDSNVSISATSPLGKKLEFNKTIDNYGNFSINYSHKRFYKDFIIKTDSQINETDLSKMISSSNIEFEKFELIKNNNNNSTYQIVYNKRYSFLSKQIDFIKFAFHKTYKYLIILFVLILVISLFYYRKKILHFFSSKLSRIKRTINIEFFRTKALLSLLSLALSIIICFFYYSIEDKETFNLVNNEVLISQAFDQYDYHTNAINFSTGQGILINGEVIPDFDYKINFGEKNDGKYNIELFTGIRNYNRFPAYSIVISGIYKLFNFNPIAVKIWQIILLCVLIFMFPLLGYKIWQNKGFWAGLLASPFLLIYIFPYSLLILPDTLTVFVNFLILWFYIDLRKNFSYKNIFISSSLLGLSFLIKASLVVLIPFIILDIIILTKKNGLKKNLLKPIIYLGIFFLLWIPYNIWSYKSFIKDANKCSELLKLTNIQPSKIDCKSFNNFTFHGNSKKLFTNITLDEIEIFKTDIEPFIEKTNYLPYNFAGDNYSSNIINLSYCKLITLNRSPYFMILLISNYGALECHNEYTDVGGITNKWLNDPNSFYNNDNLSGKSNGIRILNFYKHNPKLFFNIAHTKLKNTQNHTAIISIFSLIFLISTIVFSLKYINHKTLKYLIVMSCLFVLTLIFIEPVLSIYVYLLALCLIIFYKKYDLRKSIPIVLLCLSGIVYILISFSSHRYLTYYTFPLCLLTGYLAIATIEVLFKSVRTIKTK